MEVLAVEFEAGGNCRGRLEGEAGGIQARAEPDIGFRRGPAVLLDQLKDGERAGGFVAVDAGGEIDAAAGVGGFAGEGGESEGLGLEKSMRLPAAALRGGFHVGEDAMDIDAFAGIFAHISPQTLHAGGANADRCGPHFDG